MNKLPKAYESFRQKYPDIWQAYDQLGKSVHAAGPLSPKERELVKLGIAIGARREGAVHAHTRRALESGARPEEIYHVVVLGLTTIGFPSTIAAMTWVADEIEGQGRARRESKD